MNQWYSTNKLILIKKLRINFRYWNVWTEGKGDLNVDIDTRDVITDFPGKQFQDLKSGVWEQDLGGEAFLPQMTSMIDADGIIYLCIEKFTL